MTLELRFKIGCLDPLHAVFKFENDGGNRARRGKTRSSKRRRDRRLRFTALFGIPRETRELRKNGAWRI